MDAVLRAALLEPFSRRSRRELLWSVIGVVAGAVGWALVVLALQPGTAVAVARAVPRLGLVIVALAASGAADAVAVRSRRLARRLLSLSVPAPPRAREPRRGVAALADRLRDGRDRRATAYLVTRLPLGLLHGYALLWWSGVANLTYPFWWGLFRNHDPGVQLGPVLAITPFGFLRITTFPGAVAVGAIGAATVAAAPWLTRGVVAADRWALVTLLGPGRMALRLQQLEASRTVVAEDAAATLRRIERDLHDGAQAQLATLAMKLGQAKEKLEAGSAVAFDPAGALALVDAAHRHAKDTLVEVRNIARGIHPPALDVGLDATLATLVARSPVPARLCAAAELGASRAIETIAYFSVAELLANVARHSGARHARVEADRHGAGLRLVVTDDGTGGARAGAVGGLRGLAERVAAVDGRLEVSSPQGGPTVVIVDLPLHA